jgi:molecular chaperone DnaK
MTRAGQLYPEEVSAYVVAHLLAAAELQLDADVSKAVISVPAYFGEAQRDATVTAGRIAGLDTVKLIRCCAPPGLSGTKNQRYSGLIPGRD